MIETQRRVAFPIGLLLAALTAGCGGDVVLPDEGEAADLEIVSGDEQLGPAGTRLAQEIVVRVLDTRARPVANQDVTFTIGSGGGTVEPTTVKSNAAGQAAASWTLGPNAGSHLLRVQTPRGGSGMLEVTVSAIAVAGSGSVLAGVSGDNQTGPVSSALADSLVVKTTDALGNPVANVEVTWSVSGGGSVAPATVVTGTDGLAAAERVLGPAAGAQSAQAAVTGFTGSPVTFSHTAIPANPTALVKISGDNQTAPGGFEVAEDLVVRLEDNNGNGIGGRAITWVVPSGSGSVNPVNTTTDANGLATTRWTLPTAVGGHSVSAVFSGLPAVSFTATATADVPTTIELVSGNNQSAAVGTALPNPLVVRVTDAGGIPVANVGVAWTAEVGGTVSAANTATDASGLAQVTRTLGPLPGPYTTTAAVGGLSGSPITFTSTATVGPAAKLAIITQPGTTTATSGQALVPQPEIEVQDALGNPVLQAGRTVSAGITSSPGDPTGPGSATLAGANDQTGADGRTSYTNLRITGPSGSYVLTFSSGALIPVSSATITLGAGGASRLVIQQQPATTAASGAVINPAPIVRVEDAAGNPVSGTRNILVDIASGSGALSGTTTVSTSGGATATFDDLRITGTTGPRTLLFSSAGLTSVESGAIDITAGGASRLVIQQQPATTAASGAVINPAPIVRVEDAAGNPVSGTRNILVDIGSGSGELSGTTTVSTSGGATATFSNLRITGTVGPRTLLFSSSGLTSVESAAIDITAGPAASVAIQAGDDQTAGVGEAVPIDPAVIVRDASGNPVSGVDVQFEVTAGGGTVTPTTVTTGSNGIATVTSWTLGSTAGANTMTATASGLNTVTFDATASAATTTTSLSAEPTSSAEGEQVTFTANVTSGGGTPTGQVSFRDNGSEIGQGTLAAGVATFATTTLTDGAHSITAHYLGDGTFGTSSSAALNYNVATANVAPSAQADAFNVNEDATLTVAAAGVLGNDNDADGDDLTAQLVSGPSNAQSFQLNPNGSFTYTPVSDFSGDDSFAYQANDGQTNSNTTTVTITVNPVNDDPEFTAGGNVSTSSLISSVLGQSHAGWASGISPGPPDESSQTVSFQISTDADDAFQTTPQIDSDGTLPYRPLLRLDTIVVTASVVAVDSDGATSAPRDFSITINS